MSPIDKSRLFTQVLYFIAHFSHSKYFLLHHWSMNSLTHTVLLFSVEWLCTVKGSDPVCFVPEWTSATLAPSAKFRSSPVATSLEKQRNGAIVQCTNKIHQNCPEIFHFIVLCRAHIQYVCVLASFDQLLSLQYDTHMNTWGTLHLAKHLMPSCGCNHLWIVTL